MNHRISSAAWLLIAALAPVSLSADRIDVSDFKLFTFASFTTQRQPDSQVSDTKFGPSGSSTQAEVLLLADGIPFPNVPTGQTQAFASSAANANGEVGVGVNFGELVVPGNLVAEASIGQSITNNSASTVGMTVDFFIPAPTIRFNFGPENLPGGVLEPRATASAVMTLFTNLIHPDGSVVQTTHLDYGIQSFRTPLTGEISALPTSPDAVGLTRFTEPDSFGFRLPEFEGNDFRLPDIAPGDTLEIFYRFDADAGTVFGETGVFAAIGDPFNLNASGGRFELQVGDALPPSAVPEPGTWAMLGLGLIVLRLRFGVMLRAAQGRPR